MTPLQLASLRTNRRVLLGGVRGGGGVFTQPNIGGISLEIKRRNTQAHRHDTYNA